MSERAKTRRTKKKAAAAAAAGGRDRFEDLPVHVLELLLSFLPSHEAVRTSVLAKRWRHIWKSVPSLRIHEMVTEDYNYFVERLIELRDQIVPLDVCEILPVVDGGQVDADRWLQYAVSCQVKVIRVEILADYWLQDLHELSNNSVISEHLTWLELYHVRLELDHPLDLSRCSALEVFDIETCAINLGDVSFAKSLRRLRIKDSDLYPAHIRTRISAPGLVTCELADWRDFNPIFGSLPSLKTAFIRIIQESESDCKYVATGYCEGFCCKDDCSVLLEGLSGATNLEIILSKDLRWRPTFDKLKTVLLNDWSVTDNFTGLIYFLQHSPVLERLTLQLSLSLKSFGKMLESDTPREHFLVSKHLNVVEIKSFGVKKIQIRQVLKLLRILGVTREKINIVEDFKYWDYFSFEQKKKETSMSQS